MASGHVSRANRPNTWLHRPTLQRDDSSCQPGAVHTWPEADMRAFRHHAPVRFLLPGQGTNTTGATILVLSRSVGVFYQYHELLIEAADRDDHAASRP